MFFPPVQPGKIKRSAVACLAFGLLFFTAGQRTPASPQTADPPSATVPVLISDFELLTVSAKAAPAKPAATPQEKPKPLVTGVYQDADAPAVQARRLMDLFTATLLELLKKNGYSVARSTGQNPPAGALLRGVFAEPDGSNRIRRALLGGTSINPRFLLYVGIFNLARPDQPLYQLATEQSPSSEYGPIITLNNYIPLAKYELDKNPSDEDVRKICLQIAASLTSVLTANPAAFSH